MSSSPQFDLRRLKYAATINDEALSEETDPDFELEYVDIGNVDSSGQIHQTTAYRFEAAPSRARRKVRDGDVIISTVRTYLQAIAPIEAPPGNLIVSTGFAVVRPSPQKLDSRFCKFALREPEFLAEVERRSVGVSYPAVNASDLGDIEIPVPPLPQQRAIAAFLDRETARLDSLVAEKERLLELLAEKRRALITRAVTRGVFGVHASACELGVPSPSGRFGVPALAGEGAAEHPKGWTPNLRDSGLPRLGQIPKHWRTKKLKHIASLRSGDAITAESISESGNYPVFGGNGIRGYGSSFNHEGKFVLIGRQGALCGNINYAIGRFWASEHAVVATIRGGDDYLWLGELLRMMDLNQYSQSAAQPGLAVDVIADLLLPVPPLDEQRAIVAHIASETGKLDALRASAERTMDLLKERRAALIAAAVTGKIAVPEKPQNS
ncbi:MAG: restriction endonuclease subunit S [Verrucomicrobiota bacterium]